MFGNIWRTFLIAVTGEEGMVSAIWWEEAKCDAFTIGNRWSKISVILRLRNPCLVLIAFCHLDAALTFPVVPPTSSPNSLKALLTVASLVFMSARSNTHLLKSAARCTPKKRESWIFCSGFQGVLWLGTAHCQPSVQYTLLQNYAFSLLLKWLISWPFYPEPPSLPSSDFYLVYFLIFRSLA